MTPSIVDAMPDTSANEARLQGSAIVALHSSASSSRQWSGWKKALAPTIAFVAPDLVGYESGSSWIAGEPVTLAEEAHAVAGHFLHRDLPVHLLGHSYGGAVALEVALRYPDRVRSVTLYEPVRVGLLRSFGDREWADVLEVGHRVVALVEAWQPELAAALFVNYWSGAGTWERLPAERQWPLAAMMPKVSAEFGALFGDEVPPEAYRELRIPVRLMHGSTSPAPALRIAERLALLLPNVERRCLEGLGHMGPVQAVDSVLAASGLDRLR